MVWLCSCLLFCINVSCRVGVVFCMLVVYLLVSVCGICCDVIGGLDMVEL